MLYMVLNSEDIRISSIEKEDIMYIDKELGRDKFFIENTNVYSIDDLYERFLEYYLTEGEFFLKIENIKGDFLGFFKGRVEFKDYNVVWINCFVIKEEYRGRGLEDKILGVILKFLRSTYDVKTIYTGVTKEEKRNLALFKENGFYILRVSKEFYEINNKKKDMIILAKDFKI